MVERVHHPREAIEHVVRYAHGGLRFHDPRHTYATWLVSAGVPINDVSAVMGHVRTSTALDRYTHRLLEDRDQRASGRCLLISVDSSP
jgi:integrase